MKKRYLVFVIIALILGWFVYRALHTPRQDEVVIDSDSAPKISKDKNIPPSLKMNSAPHDPSKTSEVTKRERVYETPDESFEAFDKLEKSWLDKAQEIMGAETYTLYLEMRDRNEKEKMQAYKEYHDYLRLKYGDSFSYNISEDQSVREKEINQRYLKELLQLIGPEKFKEYTSAKDQYNEKTRRENKESIVIEF